MNISTSIATDAAPKAPVKNTMSLVRTMLGSHSSLGLFLAALAYLICLTGTVVVFVDEFRRWEQPNTPEIFSVSPEAIQRAAEETMQHTGGHEPHYIYMRLPTAEWPRHTIGIYFNEAPEKNWIVNADGSLGMAENTPWSNFVSTLHMNLHMPGLLGYAIVGLVGVGMLALAVSGVIAHPRIFKDAFALRWGGSERLQKADLHNRLSVWGLPFNIAISLTGAYIGLVSLLVFLVAAVAFDGNAEKVTEPFFAAHPAPDATTYPFPDLTGPIQYAQNDALKTEPFSIIIEHPTTGGQFSAIYGRVPKRMIYGEQYVFDRDNTPMGRVGYADGDFGKQLYMSAYPLHFGDFAGLPVKIIYAVLGLALSVVCSSGVSIWLARRRDQGRPAQRAAQFWAATVWGVPAALAITALSAIAFGASPLPVFWIALALMYAPVLRADALDIARFLRGACAVLIVAVVAAHAITFGAAAVGTTMAIAVNLGLLITAGILGVWAWRDAPVQILKEIYII